MILVALTDCPPLKPVPVITCPTLIGTAPVVTVRLVLDELPLKNTAVAVLFPLSVELMYCETLCWYMIAGNVLVTIACARVLI